jgi:hypothetical protein
MATTLIYAISGLDKEKKEISTHPKEKKNMMSSFMHYPVCQDLGVSDSLCGRANGE